jgi:hypothetical protein
VSVVDGQCVDTEVAAGTCWQADRIPTRAADEPAAGDLTTRLPWSWRTLLAV